MYALCPPQLPCIRRIVHQEYSRNLANYFSAKNVFPFLLRGWADFMNPPTRTFFSSFTVYAIFGSD